MEQTNNQEIDIDYLYLCEKEKEFEIENIQRGLFVTDQEELSANSWNLLLRKETAINKYKRQQEEIIKEIFKDG
jgi:hypothetical protein